MPDTKPTQQFGLTVGRPKNISVKFAIGDALRHIYLIGKTGTGKTTLLLNLVRQNAEHNEGLCLIDPHGDLAETLASSDECAGAIYWDLSDTMPAFTFNPLRKPPAAYLTLAASGLLDAMKHLWSDAWGVRMEHILRNVFLALLEACGATLHDVPRMLTDKTFRAGVLARVSNEKVLDFWNEEYAAWPARLRIDATAPIQNKMGALLSDPLMQKLFSGSGTHISFRKAMDEGKTIIINLAKGKLGSDTSGLLGAMLVSQIGLAAFSRADTPEADRRPFFLYVDEFQNFTTLSFTVMLSELRKYAVGLVLAHQYIHQLKPDIREAVFGNCGTLISFRVGGSDAPYLVREFEPEFDTRDLMRLPNYHAYIKLMIRGEPSKPFMMKTLPPGEIVFGNPFAGRPPA